MAFLIFARMFGWPGFIPKPSSETDRPQSDSPTDDTPTITTIKGIVYSDYSKEINFEDFEGNQLNLVMLLAGEGENIQDKCKPKSESAIGKNIKIGLFWKITATDNDAALLQVNKAKSYVTDNNLDFDYHFYFDFQGNTLLDDYTKTDSYCQNLGKTCGIILSQDTYNNNYKPNFNKINNIKYYWIKPHSSTLNAKDEDKVIIWDLADKKPIGENNYEHIEAKK